MKMNLRGSELPPVWIVEESLKQGGHAFVDEEETTDNPFDNVTSTNEEFVWLDVFGALEHMARRLQSDVTVARLESAGESEVPPGLEILGALIEP